MSVDRSYVASNHTEQVRMQDLVRRLTDADLARPMPAGWTVAAVLGHLALWDQRILVLLQECAQEGSALPPAVRDADVHWINDATKPFLLALTPRAAADLAVAVAEAVDRAAAAVSEDFLARNTAAGTPLNLARAVHRREHLDEIEHALRA